MCALFQLCWKPVCCPSRQWLLTSHVLHQQRSLWHKEMWYQIQPLYGQQISSHICKSTTYYWQIVLLLSSLSAFSDRSRVEFCQRWDPACSSSLLSSFLPLWSFLSFNFYHYPQFLPQCRSWEFCQSWGPASSRRSSPQYQSSYWDILSDTGYLSKVSSHLFLVFIIIILIIIISSYIIHRESHKNLVKGEIPPAPRLLVNLNFEPLQHLVWRKM